MYIANISTKPSIEKHILQTSEQNQDKTRTQQEQNSTVILTNHKLHCTAPEHQHSEHVFH